MSEAVCIERVALADSPATRRVPPVGVLPTPTRSSPAGPIEPLLCGLDLLAQGMAIVDIHGALRYANAAGRSRMTRLGWHLEGETLCCNDPERMAHWHTSVRRACVSGRRLLVEVGAAECRACATFVPVEMGAGTMAFVLFDREAFCGPLELQMFAAHHGLTWGERRVLDKLTAGYAPAEVARAHGVQRSTVLSQIAAIRTKTFSHSIKEVLAKLSRLPQMRNITGTAATVG